MNYLSFDKNEIVNLGSSLSQEILRTNRAGSFALSTIAGINTRKYHGLLICPIENFGDKRHILLSSLDESIYKESKDEHGVLRPKEYGLGAHRYPNDYYSPRGHKYVESFSIDKVAGFNYRLGDVRIRKEYVMIDKVEQILIKYTLEDCDEPIIMRFRPFTAFRSIHQLSKANLNAQTRFHHIANGISYNMYEGFPNLHMQFSKEVEYIDNPQWYYNIEYSKERERGYEYNEDLMVPGYFQLTLEKGESIVFSASTKEIIPGGLKTQFTKQQNTRVERENMYDCLINAGNQFYVKKGKKKQVFIYAGYPWHGIRGRDTFISLPGLALSSKDKLRSKDVLNSMLKYLRNGLFPNYLVGYEASYNSVDAPLWFIRSIQLCFSDTPLEHIWLEYGKYIQEILQAFKTGGMPFNIRMHDNHLIYAGQEHVALTWMESVIDGEPVTPRTGYQVEVNGLWYNAICYALSLAKAANDEVFIAEWSPFPNLIQQSFIENFWDDKKGYCADYFRADYKNWDVRPNMIIASALYYSPLSPEMKQQILAITDRELLTPKGLRTLSPKSTRYHGYYRGFPNVRKRAAHQGSVWPWLLEFYYETYVSVYGDPRGVLSKKILDNFEEDMSKHGVGTISELYDGNPPYDAVGAISYANSVSALLRIKNIPTTTKKKK